jgi:hypothetical protein
MATKDKLPTYAQIWGGEWIPSRVNRDFIKPRKARTAKRTRKPAKGSKRK